MPDKDIILKHEDINDPQTITGVNKKAFAEAGLDMHKDEVETLEEDFKKGIRRMKIKSPKKYFFMGK